MVSCKQEIIEMGKKEKKQPESTHWNPSKKCDIARIGNIFATYSTTSISLLYA
jgi:hypothetical protein